ncbi:DUF6415 family natural product biosynthesis protein [Streptomyces adustus]
MLRALKDRPLFDADALLDDVGAILDDCAPAKEFVEDLKLRLYGHLRRLVYIAVATDVDQVDEPTAQLIAQARTVRAQDLPDEYRQAVGHLRRTAWTVNELLERLVELRCLRAAA